ncbi:MAG: hypothetical protein HWD58_20250 [Bacteroidota bacterium]|nr:MAG: hypothetical protein HWD58_20250 [Bacteroidota bacterium]
MSNKNGQVGHREYDFYIIGFTETTLDLGNTIICLETKSDKILKKFWIKDIEVKNFKTFNDKFKINTNRKQELEHFLNEHLVKNLKN